MAESKKERSLFYKHLELMRSEVQVARSLAFSFKENTSDELESRLAETLVTAVNALETGITAIKRDVRNDFLEKTDDLEVIETVPDELETVPKGKGKG